jgi:DNA-binding MurR/RpiR family transcriptional regulator
MTAAKLGVTVNVSESTVVRFAALLGYKGYPEMQRALQEMLRGRLTSVQRMEVASQRLGGSDALGKVLQADMGAIRRTMEEISHPMFYGAVGDIIRARRIYILGVRSAAAIASFLGYYFTQIFENVTLVDAPSKGVIFEQMLRIGEGDVFIGVTFSRYSTRTLDAARYAKQSGARVVAITDSMSAPIAAVSDLVLAARSDMASFADSLVAPLSVVNALIVAIGMEKSGEIAAIYQKLEGIWDEYDIYEKNNGE